MKRSSTKRLSRTCSYCGGSHTVSERAAKESPFCSACLAERISLRAQQVGPVALIEADPDYVIVTSLRPGTRGSVPC
jgi:hypothetical protein